MADPSLPPQLATDRVMDSIQDAIAPFVGENMARASTEMLARKLEVDGAYMTAEQAAALVEKVAQGLIVFVGRAKATQLRETLRAALSEAGGAR